MADDAARVRLEADGDDTLLWIKVVPGASRNEIAGVLGDRLKVRVGAPPESGKANKAVCVLLARTLGVRQADVDVEGGTTRPEKTVRVRGAGVDGVRSSLRRQIPSARA